MDMSSRVDLAASELLDVLGVLSVDAGSFALVVRCYRHVLPAVSKKTAAILERGYFTQRLLSVDPALLPVSAESARRAIDALTYKHRHDPEWLARIAEHVAETLTVHFIDGACESCQYDLGVYVTEDGELVLRCRTETHVWCCTLADGQLGVGEPWRGETDRLRPASRSDLRRAGVAFERGDPSASASSTCASLGLPRLR